MTPARRLSQTHSFGAPPRKVSRYMRADPVDRPWGVAEMHRIQSLASNKSRCWNGLVLPAVCIGSRRLEGFRRDEREAVLPRKESPTMLFKASIANLNFEAVQDRVRCYNRAAKSGIHLSSVFLEDLTAQQVDYLVAMYVALARDVGGWPWPDMLHHLGWAGHLIHEVFCKRAGLWVAFTELVKRCEPEAPFLMPQEEKDDDPDSIPEGFVCRRVRLLPGIVSVKVHPELPGGLWG